MVEDIGIGMMKDIHLLIVDDEEPFREAIGRRLKKRGVHYREAGSGEECLSILEENFMHVVVLDVKMPGMNGIETLRLIKERHPVTEVILLTGHADAGDGVEGIKAGAFDYLAKPVEFEHLAGKIKQAYDMILLVEERKAEAEAKEEMERKVIACERLASLGTLAAGVAHEINNPLAIIQESAGWIRGILDKDEMKDMHRKQDFLKALDKIEYGVKRSKNITHQLLTVIRPNDLMLPEVDIRELVNEAVESVKGDILKKGIELFQDIGKDLNTVRSNPYQLRQCLVNLITNAIQATGNGGRIYIMTSVVNNGMSLKVKDTGEGIPRENLEKIFEPFFTTRAAGQGTGLGLFVTRSLIEKLGGTIEVESRIGKGSTFDIILPGSRKKKTGLHQR